MPLSASNTFPDHLAPVRARAFSQIKRGLLLVIALSAPLAGCGASEPSADAKIDEEPTSRKDAGVELSCDEGAQRVIACGEDDRGSALEICEDGEWALGECIEPSACAEDPSVRLPCEEHTASGTVIGIRRGACVDGEWEDELDHAGETRCQHFLQVSAGDDFHCALRTTGEVLCWGAGAEGQTANPDLEDSSVPTLVAGVSDAIAITSSFAASCALKASGEVLCWGSPNTSATTEVTTTPSPVYMRADPESEPVLLDDAIAIDGYAHTVCATRRTGEAVCWGSNGSQRLGTTQVPRTGDNAGSEIALPVQAGSDSFEPLGGIRSVAAGRFHTCANLESGKIVCWGDDTPLRKGAGPNGCGGELPPCEVLYIDDAIRISSGGERRSWTTSCTCAIREEGSVWCWGTDNTFLSGRGEEPEEIIEVDSPFGVPVDLSVSSDHNCVVFDTGKIACWGNNWNGRLGNGNMVTTLTPTAVVGIEWGALHVASSRGSTCAVVEYGERVACWGLDQRFATGHGGDSQADTATPRQIGWPACADGTTRTIHCGLNGRGVAQQTCAGGMWSGECVDPDSCVDGSEHPRTCSSDGLAGLERRICTGGQVPTTAPGGGSFDCQLFVSIGAGRAHSCALRTDGSVLCWGSNSAGQLGENPDHLDRALTPIEIGGVSGAVALAVGDDHNCVVRENGEAVCWGSGGHGQLGNGATSDSHLPVNVSGLNDAVAITAGAQHSCAIRESGRAVCWGSGENGRLGSGATANASSPAEVSELENVRAISAGAAHTCAATTRGSAHCWGSGEAAKLGTGTSSDELRPYLIESLEGVVGIAAGRDHSCAALNSGEVRCWGGGSTGQLGDGGTALMTTPTAAIGISSAVAITAGAYHTCALLSSGEARCWGLAENGRLGVDGDAISSGRVATPSPVLSDHGFRSFAAGAQHSCAIADDGLTAECTGAAGSGRLGHGVTTDSDELVPALWP